MSGFVPIMSTTRQVARCNSSAAPCECPFQFLLFLVFEILQASLCSSYLLKRGSILWFFLKLDSLVGSENLKKAGANSTSHLGSMAVTSLMYSLVVCTTS